MGSVLTAAGVDRGPCKFPESENGYIVACKLGRNSHGYLTSHAHSDRHSLHPSLEQVALEQFCSANSRGTKYIEDSGPEALLALALA